MSTKRMLKKAKTRLLTRAVQTRDCVFVPVYRAATVREWDSKGNKCRRISKCKLMLAALFLTGCGRAPSFDVLGSFFPAWLVCLALGVVFTAAARWLLSRIHIVIALPVLTYPSLAALFSFGLWLALFR
jgi:hypothetical protein